jgi:hypothetical protein
MHPTVDVVPHSECLGRRYQRKRPAERSVALGYGRMNLRTEKPERRAQWVVVIHGSVPLRYQQTEDEEEE